MNGTESKPAGLYDTLSTARELEQSGMQKAQAEAVALAIKSGHGELATKSDLEVLKIATKSDFEAFKVEMRSDFEAFKVEMRSDFEAFKVEMRSDFEALRVETKSEISGVRRDIKWLKWAIGLNFAATLALIALVAI